ncbi:MAG TPA: cytochrome c maturation protein CcmE [Acidobacteriaceae bacterium]|nr:cytochrome c maturation protein CcmE [Acidobacteriaceae bacterium]
MQSKNQGRRIGIAVVVVLAVISWLAITGVRSNKSYYVTIKELQAMGSKAYTRHLRVAGSVEPGSIQRAGTHVDFVLVEKTKTKDMLHVSYTGVDPVPDTFKDNALALAIGTYGHDGVFHATQVQAKCASKYAPVPPKNTATAQATASVVTPAKAM